MKSCVVGIGAMGLEMALHIQNKGMDVVGVDLDTRQTVAPPECRSFEISNPIPLLPPNIRATLPLSSISIFNLIFI